MAHEFQHKLDTEGLGAAVRQYVKMPNAEVKLVANINGDNLDVYAIVTGGSASPEPPQEKGTVATVTIPGE